MAGACLRPSERRAAGLTTRVETGAYPNPGQPDGCLARPAIKVGCARVCGCGQSQERLPQG
ncbi:protein of unknown function [Cupriavidus neocaledonicus]|uniref:Uncharacterized protein n=1 Tax=Cupriavidus neocaledonicus TaxID=1040979 RepID=A0A375HD17_9BURK|nr:hypothetical protein CBM2605_A260118 [Cupriavidus neocaledonicus]SPD48239.1 protein of unknown function [Cupriavidus neocaledonicus]